MTTGTAEFSKRLDQTAEDTEALLAKLLSDATESDEIVRPKRLIEAMRYSSLGGGKRLRPFLAVESAAVFGIPRESALLVGAALECIHCYSLIHDDLPAMDIPICAAAARPCTRPMTTPPRSSPATRC